MVEIHLCDYGCGREAKFQMTSGKWCCEKHYTKCPSILNKTKHYGPKNIPYGKEIINIDNKLCEYGCGKVAKYKLNNGKNCCSESHNSCTGIKHKFIITEIENTEELLCDYGCGQIARYKMNNGKLCCENFYSKCPVLKLKTFGPKNKSSCEDNCTNLVEYRFKNGKVSNYKDCNNCSKFIETPKKKMKITVIKIETNELCNYCNKNKAEYLLKNKKICCQDSVNKCPEQKNKNSKSTTGKKRKSPKSTGSIVKMAIAITGMKRTEEDCIKISNRLMGHDSSPERNLKISIGNKKFLETHDPSMLGKHLSEETRKKISIKNTGNKRSDKFKEEQRQRMLNGGAVHAISFVRNPSKPQVELFNRIKELYPNAKINYPFYRGEGESNYSLDVAIPEHMIWFESDGTYYHQDKEKDMIRQRNIEKLGWKCIRYYPVDFVSQVPSIEQIKIDINNILENKNEPTNER